MADDPTLYVRLRAKPGDPKLVPVTTNISEDAYRALSRMADKKGLPLAAFIREVPIRRLLEGEP